MLTAIRDLWWLTKACRIVTILLVVGALIEQVLELTVPLIVGRVIDVVSTNDPATIHREGAWLVLLLALSLTVNYIFHFFSRYGMVYLIHHVKGTLTCEAFDHLLSLPVGFHETRNTGNKTKVIQSGAEKAAALTDGWTGEGLPIMFHYVLSASILLWIWWPAGLLIGVIVPIVVLISVLFYRWGKAAREERHDCYEASESLLVEAIQNVATVQSFHVEESHSRKIRDIWERIYYTGFKEMRSANYGFFVRNTAIVGSVATIMYLGLGAVAERSITGGTFILVLFITMKMMAILWPLDQIIDNTIHNAPSLRRLCELFSIESDVQETDIAISLQECKGSLTFENVSFRYPGRDDNALKNLSLSIRPGTTVALVGPSGAGKSTIFKLALRFSDPHEGRILLDGHDLRNLKLNFREYIAVVSQEIDIFSGTIADNIAFGRNDLSEQDIIRIARIAHVDEFVEKLPDRYNTLVGERGLKLSGGQRQRLAIARAIAVDCPIIFFDEATSHLDPESESLIQQAMKTLAGSRTILIIAHRLSTIRNADSIIVMDDGRVAEEGTHETLKSIEDGLYQKHLNIQSR